MALLKDINIASLPDDPNERLDSVVKQLNEWGRIISTEGTTKIYKDNAGNERVLIGLQGSDFSGLKVSKPGYDVGGASDDELVFNSDNNVFKIVASGSATITSHTVNTGAGNFGTGQSTTTVPHNLGYAPIAMVFRDTGTYYAPFSGALTPGQSTSSSYIHRWFYWTVDATNLYITLGSFSYNITVDTDALSTVYDQVKYYLLQETAN